jgi:hypothetical protein
LYYLYDDLRRKTDSVHVASDQFKLDFLLNLLKNIFKFRKLKHRLEYKA